MKLPTLDTNWYVLRTKVRAESLAEEELRLGGYHAYVPRRRRRSFVRRHRLITDSQEPLMPGYLFLAESRLIEWGLLRDERRFPHVGRPLCSTVGPLHIPAEIVVKIHQDEVDGKFDETGATKKSNRAKLALQFAAGLQVRVGEGPFSGFLATCDHITAQGRIKALVNIFGRLASVDFEAGQLEAA